MQLTGQNNSVDRHTQHTQQKIRIYIASNRELNDILIAIHRSNLTSPSVLELDLNVAV